MLIGSMHASQIEQMIQRFHMQFMDPYDLATFYDRFKSFYELYTVYFGLLQVLTMYIYGKIQRLVRVVTDNYEQFTGILRPVYVLLRVFMSPYDFAVFTPFPKS